ncbi:gamma-glutamyltransferase [Acidobacteria bacterium AH-259-D05]|nr:gamma-glutamyltransferase [Acidobacteria bacterium AH-259-D05]
MKISLLMCFFLLMAPLLAADRITGRPFATRSEVIAQHGVAATSHPLATQIAIDILQQGGNAVDAAIAANAAQGLMEPTGCGIGGDLFAILWVDKEQKLYGLNASGRSPYALTLEEFKKRNLQEIPIVGPLPVSVPGAVDGWFELHKRFGKLPMEKILEPTIRYARQGFPVTQVIASSWANGAGRLKDQPNFASTFLPRGKAPSEGEIFRNPDLAGTLEKIAKGGRDVFYRGEISRTIDEFCKRVGCFLGARDLSEHTSTWVEPVSVNYRGYEVWELPPNGQGIAVLQMLNILEAFDLRSMGHNSAEYLHHLVEAKKIAFEDRAKFYADPDFNKIPVAELISKEYARKRRELLDPQRASLHIPAGDPKLEKGDTIYLTVADREHNMISLIQSNYAGLGSGLVPDGLGFVFQNRGALFNLQEGHFNSYAPHKRPFHTIIPAFVTKNGQPFLSFGVMGGDMQPQGHVQILANIIDFGMNLQEAGDAPRFCHFGSSTPTGSTMSDGGELALESGVSDEVTRLLVEKGHRLQSAVGAFGGYQAIMYDAQNNVYRGASESRKDGMAAGF